MKWLLILFLLALVFIGIGSLASPSWLILVVPAVVVAVVIMVANSAKPSYKENDNAPTRQYDNKPYVIPGPVAGRHGHYHRQVARRQAATAKAIHRFMSGDPKMAAAMFDGSFDKAVDARYDKLAESLGITGEDIRQNLRDNPHFYDS